jgi:hypothetical protein
MSLISQIALRNGMLFICEILRDQRETYLDIHLKELLLIIKNIRH